MQDRNLPETYKGYLTKDLTEMLATLGAGKALPDQTPREKIIAMGCLDREFKLSPVSRA